MGTLSSIDIENNVDSIQAKVTELEKLSTSISDAASIKTFYEIYTMATDELESLLDGITQFDSSPLTKAEIDYQNTLYQIGDTLDYLYDSSSVPINTVILDASVRALNESEQILNMAQKAEETASKAAQTASKAAQTATKAVQTASKAEQTAASLEQDMKSTQALQLTVFSIILTILAFVLTNAKILAADGIDLRNVLLVNISYLIAVCTLFALIYLFIYPAVKNEKRKLHGWFIGLIIFLAIVLVCVSLIPSPQTTQQTQPNIATVSLSQGKINTSYSQTLAATGNSPITWIVSSGVLPDGLALDSTTGEISGQPVKINTFYFVIKATNTAGEDEKALSIVVIP